MGTLHEYRVEVRWPEGEGPVDQEWADDGRLESLSFPVFAENEVLAAVQGLGEVERTYPEGRGAHVSLVMQLIRVGREVVDKVTWEGMPS